MVPEDSTRPTIAHSAGALAADHTGVHSAGVSTDSADVGDALPDAELLDVHGVSTTLAAARAGRPAVIVLYRGTWCPYCNLALRTYQQDLVPLLDHRGIVLIAISPQKPDGSMTMQEKNELTFTVLSDPGNQVAAALGVLTTPFKDGRDAQRTIGIALTELNIDGTTGLPMPTVAIVDTTGIIRWVDVHADHTTRTEVADIVSALATLD